MSSLTYCATGSQIKLVKLVSRWANLTRAIREHVLPVGRTRVKGVRLGDEKRLK